MRGRAFDRTRRVCSALALVLGLGLPAMPVAAADSATHPVVAEVNQASDVTTAAAASFEAAAIVPQRACADLPNAADYAAIKDAPTEISSATVVAASGSTPEYCDVKGIISPQIHFELKLPTTTWQGRYLQQGCGGYCGAIPNTSFPVCDLQPGGDFAVAATDDGHTGSSVWALDDQQLRIDYGYRAVHVLSIAAKSIIQTYYGSAAQHSYFSGCSDGGREAMSEAERFPEDFDGIVAGALEIYAAELNVEVHAWDLQANTDSAGHTILTPDKLPALHQAVIAACDGADGLVDGQIDDPRACHFDPAAIQCPTGTDNASCLTPAQVEAARKIYAGPRTLGGERLYPGALTYGSEIAWAPFVSAASAARPLIEAFANSYLRFQAYEVGHLGPTVYQWNFTRQAFESLLPEAGVEDALYANLAAFRNRGGKLLIYHGWADQAIPSEGSIAYYEALEQHMGGLRSTQEFARLFMIPTMFHCSGGYGPNQFDTINAITHWVERGEAPDELIVSGPDPQNPSVTRTRPVFPYPQRAVYSGSGSIDDAANFTSAPPTADQRSDLRWIGEFLYDRAPRSPLLEDAWESGER